MDISHLTIKEVVWKFSMYLERILFMDPTRLIFSIFSIAIYQEDFLEKYEELEQVVARCYNNEAMQPSSAEIQELFSSMQMSWNPTTSS